MIHQSCALSSFPLYSPVSVTLHPHSPSFMGYTDADYQCRDENEGSVVTSLISQLRFAVLRPRPTRALAKIAPPFPE
jgi:hypothetical protein